MWKLASSTGWHILKNSLGKMYLFIIIHLLFHGKKCCVKDSHWYEENEMCFCFCSAWDLHVQSHSSSDFDDYSTVIIKITASENFILSTFVRFQGFFSLGLHFSPVAMSHLNGQKVFGKVMRVTLSKHQTVALPREGLDDQLLTKGKMILEGNKAVSFTLLVVYQRINPATGGHSTMACPK